MVSPAERSRKGDKLSRSLISSDPSPDTDEFPQINSALPTAITPSASQSAEQWQQKLQDASQSSCHPELNQRDGTTSHRHSLGQLPVGYDLSTLLQSTQSSLPPAWPELPMETDYPPLNEQENVSNMFDYNMTSPLYGMCQPVGQYQTPFQSNPMMIPQTNTSEPPRQYGGQASIANQQFSWSYPAAPGPSMHPSRGPTDFVPAGNLPSMLPASNALQGMPQLYGNSVESQLFRNQMGLPNGAMSPFEGMSNGAFGLQHDWKPQMFANNNLSNPSAWSASSMPSDLVANLHNGNNLDEQEDNSSHLLPHDLETPMPSSNVHIAHNVKLETLPTWKTFFDEGPLLENPQIKTPKMENLTVARRSQPALNTRSRRGLNTGESKAGDIDVVTRMFPLDVLRSLRRSSNTVPSLSSITGGQNDAQIQSTDAKLIRWRQEGLSYREIKERGGFSEAESTLRGRYRTLTKHRSERPRKPVWRRLDIEALAEGVELFAPNTSKRMADRRGSNVRQPGGLANVPWKKVAQWMHAERGTHRYGNATVKKKYLEILEKHRLSIMR